MARRIKKTLFISPLVISIALLIGADSSRSFALRNLKKGDTVKNYEVALLDGSSQAMAGFSGEKGLFLIFWTTWSDRSLQLLKFAESDLLGTYKDKGISILGVNVEGQSFSSEDQQKVMETIENLKVSFPIGIDKGLVIYDEVGVVSTPTSLLLSKDLVIEDAYPGFPSVARDEIPDLLKSYLGIKEEKPQEEAQYLLAKKPKNNALLYYNLGKNLYKRYLSRDNELKKVPKNVITKLDESIKRDPDFYAPYVLKTIIFHKAKEEALMEQELKVIEEKGFSEPIEIRDMAYMYFMLGMDEKATQLLAMLEEKIPDEPSVSLLKSLLEVRGVEPDEASALLVEILGTGNLPFDPGGIIDPETGRIREGQEPDTLMDRISEKVLNISKK